MSVLLRNDDAYTVRVSVTPDRHYLCEVHRGLTQIIGRETKTSEECVSLAAGFVDHHISSRVTWALVEEATAAPRVMEMSAGYTRDCRRKVAALYSRSEAPK